MKEKFLIVIFICFLSLMSSSMVFALDGPHEVASPPEEGACAVCHIPHKAEGPKIWAQEIKQQHGIFGGVHQLCYSCHDGSYSGASSGMDSYDNLAGKGNVFLLEGADHVMHGGACIEPGAYPKADSLRDDNDEHKDKYEDEEFPLDPNDRDLVPDVEYGDAHGRSNVNYKEGGAGFYCGSCHDPHKNAGDAYLRYKNDDIGDDRPANDASEVFGVRKTFCRQCHGVPHAEDKDCMDCHAPHRGATEMIKSKEEIARWILLAEATEVTFATLGAVFPDPNTNGFPTLTPLAERPSLCYGCHNPKSEYGDTIAVICDEKFYHHPMGLFAEKGKSPRALGTDAAVGQYPNRGAWDQNNQLDCLSCHTYHECREEDCESNNNSYLRWDFKNDSEEFCVECHDDKEDITLLGEIKTGHRQTQKDSALTNREVFNDGKQNVGSKNCMFCHYIHDGTKNERFAYNFEHIKPFEIYHRPDQGQYIPAELDALMRVPAKVLLRKWADADILRSYGEEPKYYEDMCYGCHGRESIVDGDGKNGSLLKPDIYFSHRYAVDPNQENNPYHNMEQKEDFPRGGEESIDDYGVEDGYMYCGSCHNVHNNTIAPYLNGSEDPYTAYSDSMQGFCQGCHEGTYWEEGEGKNWIDKTHPVYREYSGKGTNYPVTTQQFYNNPAAETFTDILDGGSGKKGAVFDGKDTSGEAPILCLSCHNVHAAMTSYDGSKAKSSFDNPSIQTEIGGHGKLLVIDNNKNGRMKSNLCIQCHPM